MGTHPKPILPTDMPPMMPFDLPRFEGAPMVPPMFPYQMPPVGVPGMPIPPPPAPQPLPTEAEDYELEMAAMASEIMQQGGYGQQPMMSQYVGQHQPMPPQAPPQILEEDVSEEAETVDPYMAAEIASIVHTLTTSQLTYVLSAFKTFLDKSPNNAKRFLVNNPQLVYALLHAQYVLGHSDELVLPLNALDKNLASLNKGERDAAAGVDDHEDTEYESEPHSHSTMGNNLGFTDPAEEPVDVIPEVAEAPRVEPHKRGQSRAVGSKRRRDPKSRGGSAIAVQKSGKTQKEVDSRNADRSDDGRPQQAEAPQENLSPSMPVTDLDMPMHPPYEVPLMVHSPGPLPLQVPIMGSVPMPRTIDDIMREVQPAPPILVEEVLKNTEILTNIQRATVAEMQSWPPEQRLQVLSIKLALHFRGISVNL